MRARTCCGACLEAFSGAEANISAAGVLADDVEQSRAFAATLAGQVYQRTAAAFRLSMTEAIPQLEFDLRLRGSSVADGIDVVFRESVCTNSDSQMRVRGDDNGEHLMSIGLTMHSSAAVALRLMDRTAGR